MGKKNGIQVLLSKAVYPDSSIRLLDELTGEEKEKYTEHLVGTLEEQMNYYFLQHPEDWKHILWQSGGPDGELAASMRYLAQRYTMPYKECMALLTDIGTEELAHLEMICAIVYQLTKGMSMEELKASGFDRYYVDHTSALWPQAAGGVPFNANQFQSKGDVITDLMEDLAAEQKARTTYDNLLRLVKDPEVAEPLRFLRAREVVHFQRFGEALRITQEHLDSRNFYIMNPEFDTGISESAGDCCDKKR